MRRGRLFLFLALILVILLAVIVIFGRGSLFPSTQTPDEPLPTPEVPRVNVVIVTQKIARGSQFTEDLVSEVEVPEDLLVPGMITNKVDILGRRAKFDLDAGVILSTAMLTDSALELSKTGSDWALQIPNGMVAVSIPISRLSSVSYAPQRGDHVNVIVTMNFIDIDLDFQSALPNSIASIIAPGQQGAEGPDYLTAQVNPSSGALEGRGQEDGNLETTLYLVPSEKQRPRMVSQTLIENVIVLQVGNFPLPEEQAQALEPTAEVTVEPTAEPAPGEVVVEEPALVLPDVMTLMVTPQDAVTLNYLIFSGAKLTMSLRSANDDTISRTDAVTLEYLLTRYNIPVPVKLPYGVEPRVDVLNAPVLPNDAVATPTP
jgi:pilus assembly protein CpaB